MRRIMGIDGSSITVIEGERERDYKDGKEATIKYQIQSRNQSLKAYTLCVRMYLDKL